MRPDEFRILILAPTQRDGSITARLLSEAGFAARLCPDADDLAAEIERGCGGIIVAEEAITGPALERIVPLLETQESWSDLPLTIITGHGELTTRDMKRVRLFGPVGNVTLLERPLRPITLLNAVEVALRARRRQYEVRDLLLELQHKERRQRFLAETSRVFVSSLEYRQILQRFTNLAVPSFADVALVDVVSSSGELARVARAFIQFPTDEDTSALFAEPPPPASKLHPVRVACEKGEPSFHHFTIDAWPEKAGFDQAEIRLLNSLQLASLLVVPLEHSGNIHGAITFWRSQSTAPFTLEEYELAEELAKRAALSVANARLYEQLRTNNDELEARVAERTTRLRETVLELEAFSYTVSHDLRAPLRTLHGFSEILLADYGPLLDPEGLDFLRRIASGAERLDDLIENLLALARLGQGTVSLEKIDLNTFIPALIREYPSLHEKARFIHLKTPLATVLGHRSHLAQCLSNLLINALKFVDASITPRVEISSEQRGHSVRLWVKDNGIGIKEEHLQKIFEPFQRLHNQQEYEGSGMGLAIVRRAVQKMGGQVGVCSHVGDGSEFWFELAAPCESLTPRLLSETTQKQLLDLREGR